MIEATVATPSAMTTATLRTATTFCFTVLVCSNVNHYFNSIFQLVHHLRSIRCSANHSAERCAPQALSGAEFIALNIAAFKY
jgi:hypothetical protein